MTGQETSAREVVRILRALEAAHIGVGVTGGWGVDALVRRQTRPHRDLDLGVSTDDVGAAIAATEVLGYTITEDRRPTRLVLVSDRGRIDLHPIAWDSTGNGLQTGFDDEVFRYPPGSLDAEGEIGGERVTCGTPALQLAFHQGYEPTERDRRDMAALARAFDLTLPAALSR